MLLSFQLQAGGLLPLLPPDLPPGSVPGPPLGSAPDPYIGSRSSARHDWGSSPPPKRNILASTLIGIYLIVSIPSCAAADATG